MGSFKIGDKVRCIKRHGGKFYVFRATYESINTVTSRSL